MAAAPSAEAMLVGAGIALAIVAAVRSTWSP